MELPINKYYIEEIKYKLNDNKSVVFKMHNFMLKDVEVINETTEVSENNNENETNEEKNKESKEIFLSGKPKELHDYEPVSCLRKENGMQEALNASRKKEWKNGFDKKDVAEMSLLAENMLKTANVDKDMYCNPVTQDEIEDYKKGKYGKITSYLKKEDSKK